MSLTGPKFASDPVRSESVFVLVARNQSGSSCSTLKFDVGKSEVILHATVRRVDANVKRMLPN